MRLLSMILRRVADCVVMVFMVLIGILATLAYGL